MAPDLPAALVPRREPIELARCVAAGDFAPDVRAWLRSAFELQRDAGVSLEAALELDRANRIRARDRALLRAAEALGPAPSVWALAGRLEGAVRRFRARVWPRVRAGLPVDLSPLDDALRVAFSTGERVPATQRSLFDLLD